MNKVLIKGNEAIAEAAVQAGCEFYFGYPITPSSEVMEYLSKRLPEIGATFVQAESEVASINMVFGAAGAGKRVMTASSSPGISLMQEGISYLAAMELPAVIVNVMRMGPGLGNIGPSQADYFQATRGGGHGDYRTIVLAPNSIQEIIDLMQDAFDLADKYRNPVMVIIEGLMGQMMEPVVFEKKERPTLPTKTWATTGAKGRDRNVMTTYVALEDGEATANRLNEKYALIPNEVQQWEEFMMDDAEFAVVAFGTVSRIAKNAIQKARSEGYKVGLIRPITLWPFPVKAFAKRKNQIKGYLSAELSAGQMIEDVKLAIECVVPVHFFGRVGGTTPMPGEILAEIKKHYPAGEGK